MSARVDRRCAVLAGLCFTLCVAGAAVAPAEIDADAAAGAARLPGLVVEEVDAPRAADGRLLDEPGLGARARVLLPPALERRLGELADERARVVEVEAPAVAPDKPVTPPDDAVAPPRVAPPRMDAGDRDPDRLYTLPPLPGGR